MIAFFLALIFTVILSPTTASTSLYGSQDIRPNQRPLTLEQVENLVRLQVKSKSNDVTKDHAIAGEISRSGIGFTVTRRLIEHLKELGAGPETVAALRAYLCDPSERDAESVRTKILVAEFEGPSLDGAGVATTILDELQDASRNQSGIEIVHLTGPISAKQGRATAAQRARELNADIIIWGWYTKSDREVLVTVHFQLLDEIPNVFLISEKQSLILPISDLFKFHLSLGKEMGYLTFFALGVERLGRADFSAARAFFSEAIKSSKAPKQMVNLADAYMLRAAIGVMEASIGKTNGLRSALDDADKALELNPTTDKAYPIKCAIRLMLDQRDLALVDCEKAVGLNPNSPDALSARSWVLQSLGETQRAGDDLKKAIQISEASGEQGRALIYRAFLSFQQDDVDAYITAFTELLEKACDAYPAQISLLMRGHGYNEKKQYDLAEKDFKRVIELSPSNSIAYWGLGDVLRHQKKYPGAIQNYNMAIKLGLTAPDLFDDLADVYAIEGAHAKAQDSYSTAIRLNPESSDAYRYRAYFLRKNREYDKAIEDFNVAIRLDPKSGSLYVSRGFTFFRMKQWDPALADYNEAIRLMPHNADAYYFRGLLHDDKGDRVAAIANYDAALQLTPSDELIIISRGLAYWAQDNCDGAIADFTRVIILAPGNASPYFYRSSCYLRKGRKSDAIADLNKVLQLSSDPTMTKRAQEILNSLNP